MILSSPSVARGFDIRDGLIIHLSLGATQVFQTGKDS